MLTRARRHLPREPRRATEVAAAVLPAARRSRCGVAGFGASRSRRGVLVVHAAHHSREELLFSVERDHRCRIRRRRRFKGKDQKRSLPLHTHRAARVRAVACRKTPMFFSLREKVRFFLSSKAVYRSIDSAETAFRKRKTTILGGTRCTIGALRCETAPITPRLYVFSLSKS